MLPSGFLIAADGAICRFVTGSRVIGMRFLFTGSVTAGTGMPMPRPVAGIRAGKVMSQGGNGLLRLNDRTADGAVCSLRLAIGQAVGLHRVICDRGMFRPGDGLALCPNRAIRRRAGIGFYALLHAGGGFRHFTLVPNMRVSSNAVFGCSAYRDMIRIFGGNRCAAGVYLYLNSGCSLDIYRYIFRAGRDFHLCDSGGIHGNGGLRHNAVNSAFRAGNDRFSLGLHLGDGSRGNGHGHGSFCRDRNSHSRHGGLFALDFNIRFRLHSRHSGCGIRRFHDGGRLHLHRGDRSLAQVQARRLAAGLCHNDFAQYGASVQPDGVGAAAIDIQVSPDSQAGQGDVAVSHGVGDGDILIGAGADGLGFSNRQAGVSRRTASAASAMAPTAAAASGSGLVLRYFTSLAGQGNVGQFGILDGDLGVIRLNGDVSRDNGLVKGHCPAVRGGRHKDVGGCLAGEGHIPRGNQDKAVLVRQLIAAGGLDILDNSPV